jgi:hypothetical protein
MEYKIEKGIPIPPRRCGRKPRYPFGQMEIGDSVIVEIISGARAATTYGRRHGKKFQSEKQADGKYRVWRVK